MGKFLPNGIVDASGAVKWNVIAIASRICALGAAITTSIGVTTDAESKDTNPDD